MTNPTENRQDATNIPPVKTLSKAEVILTGMVRFALKSDAVVPICFLMLTQAAMMALGVLL